MWCIIYNDDVRSNEKIKWHANNIGTKLRLLCQLTRSTLLCSFFCIQDFQISVAFKLINLHMYVCLLDLGFCLPNQNRCLILSKKCFCPANWQGQLYSAPFFIQDLQISMVSMFIALSMRMSDTQLPSGRILPNYGPNQAVKVRLEPRWSLYKIKSLAYMDLAIIGMDKFDWAQRDWNIWGWNW